jgi:hypothetical protein
MTAERKCNTLVPKFVDHTMFLRGQGPSSLQQRIQVGLTEVIILRLRATCKVPYLFQEQKIEMMEWDDAVLFDKCRGVLATTIRGTLIELLGSRWEKLGASFSP